MTPEQFLKQNQLSYQAYRQIRERFGHVGSFAYWPMGFPDKGAAPLLADSERDFNARLRGHLQKGVVILGTNYGVRPYTPANDVHEDQKLTVAERLAKLKKYYDLQNQYGGEHIRRAFHPEFEIHNGRLSVLSGAYMTDLFKFSEDEGNQWLASGIATTTAAELDAYLSEHKQAIPHNIDGLHYELHEVLGVGEQIVIVMLGGTVQRYAKQLQAAFPEALLVKYTHYAARQYPGTFFQAKGRALNEEVLAGIAKW